MTDIKSIAVGTGGIKLADLGAGQDGEDTRLPDGAWFHPDFEEDTTVGALFLLGYRSELQSAGFETGVAAAVLGTAVVFSNEVTDGIPAVFFPERSNFDPSKGEETVNISKLTYVRLS